MRAITAFVVVICVISATISQAAVTVTAIRIEESRIAEVVSDNVGHGANSLKVVVAIKGPEADGAAKYGNLKVDEATDDQGASIVAPKDAFHDPARFTEFSNEFFRKTDVEQGRPKPAPQIDINLAMPKRSASKIARLRGSFELQAQGTIRTIEVRALPSIREKKLDIPAQAGVSVTCRIKPEEKQSVELVITGDETVIESMEVVNPAGQSITNGMSGQSSDNGPTIRTLEVDKPLDNTMRLIVKYALNRTKTTIPFDLKDISLP